jgi:hypothetical protein
MFRVFVQIAPYLLALALGLVIGWIDIHQSEVQVAAFLMLVCGALLGGCQQRGAWLSGILLGSGIVLFHLIRVALGLGSLQNGPQPNVFAGFLALIPALIGVAVGVGARALFGRPGPEA